MYSRFATRVITTTLLIVLAVLMITPASAGESGGETISWDIQYSQQPVTYLGADSVHISETAWWILFIFGFVLFLASLKWGIKNGSDILAGISTILFGFLSLTAFNVQSWTYEIVTVQLNESAQVSLMPVVYTQPPWLVLITVMMLFIGVINVYRIHIGTLVASAKPRRR
jgi:hypothetical protein